jgi:hypothetical protein
VRERAGVKIMRDFNILHRAARTDRILFSPIARQSFLWRRDIRSTKMAESPQSLTMY